MGKHKPNVVFLISPERPIKNVAFEILSKIADVKIVSQTGRAPPTGEALEQIIDADVILLRYKIITAEVMDAVKAAVQLNGRSGSMAVYATRLPTSRAVECGSNGQTVVAIVRNGVLKTVMLRRDNQPRTRSALRVDMVV